ncbi:hypothetical protein BCR35DRAFT_308252 [Leucosporidium creatinivorum]|uniref:Uncharacterized protein n=1 Tax=Leucosporidium creatinivorum TaxID=106004 RepID=A0A1Y2E9S0_9BASI|nr:hypothetical protein BCR35DRAFT_308252 [Leucosporidium creatinivorum]
MPTLTPCDLAWSSVDVNAVLPPLTVSSPLASTWSTAMSTRDDLLQLFNGFSPFFSIPDAEAEGSSLRMELGLAIQQAEGQRKEIWWTLGGLPSGANRREMIVISLRGEPAVRRPFCQFMSYDYIDHLLRSYVQGIASRMIRSARRPQQASMVVYLVARHWTTLDPLRRAQGVLAAKGYDEYIKSQAAVAGHSVPVSSSRRSLSALSPLPS